MAKSEERDMQRRKLSVAEKSMNTQVDETYYSTRLWVGEAGPGQIFITALSSDDVDAHVSASEIYVQAAHFLSEMGMEVVHERIFGSLDVRPQVLAARKGA